GPISITANSVVLDGSAPSSVSQMTGIRSVTLAGSANAADITINTGTLTILANGEIVTNTRGPGNAGGVAVTATGALSIDATGALVSSGIGSVASPGATGKAGDIAIGVGSLSIVGNPGPLSPSTFLGPSAQPFSGVSAQTLSSGKGGSITVDLATGARL